jgi:hypothetical protein
MEHCHFFSCIRYDRRPSTLEVYTNGMGIDEEVIQTSVSKTRRVSPYHLQILQFFQFSANSRTVRSPFQLSLPHGISAAVLHLRPLAPGPHALLAE